MKKSTWYIAPIAIINGLLYFAVAVAGADNLQHLFQFNYAALMYLISMGAVICYGMFTYKSFEYLSLKPQKFYAWCLAILSPFAACSFLTAGIEGASKLNIFNYQTIIIIGTLLFLMRTINFIDGAAKFPDRLKEIKSTTLHSFKKRNYKTLICSVIIIYTTLGYSLSTTDSIYTASVKISSALGVMSMHSLSIVGYVSSAIGFFVGLPMILYWTQRGITQLTNSGMPDNHGVVRDPTDFYTYLGLCGTLPVILGSLGAATSSSAQVFGQLGLFSDIVRVSSSTIFAVCAGIPGLATLMRGFKYLKVVRQTKPQYVIK